MRVHKSDGERAMDNVDTAAERKRGVDKGARSGEGPDEPLSLICCYCLYSRFLWTRR
jgi:hypothetical protein